ncbi:MAG: class I SAM-dependent methyltransferase, partial [Pseudobdellovibrionaceae bacterium]|nr:class I SAM-dependent methyltransferase [Pseudobdellovibrionaceae bacterium]
DQGYKVTSVDRSQPLADLAKSRLGVQIEVGSFDDVEEASIFEGVWANSSLLHLDDEKLKLDSEDFHRGLKIKHKAITSGLNLSSRHIFVRSVPTL